MGLRTIGGIAIRGFRRTRWANLVAAVAFIGASTAITSPAFAQQTINVTFIAGFPPGATFVGSFLNGYVGAVDAALAKTGKYKINWNLAHSGQIAKPRGELEALSGGLGDIAVIPTPYYLDRVPLYEVVFVTPFSVHEPGYLGKVFATLEAKFPQYHQAWEKINQKLIVTTINADNYVVVTTKRVNKIADLKGMKIGAVGPNSPWLSHIGATPVMAAMSDWYTGLNTGTYQGALVIAQVLSAFKLCEPAKFLLDPRLGSSSQINLNVNISNFWNRLPDEVKKAMMDAGPIYDREQVRLLTEGAKAALDMCRKQQGLVEAKLSDEERVSWANSMPSLGKEWAARMERQGLPGKSVLKTYMDAMRAGKQPIARHWDRE